MLWTSLHTSTAGSTLLGINLGNTCLGVYLDSIESTSLNAIAITQTTISTSCLTNIERRSYGTALRAVVLVGARTLCTHTTATNSRHSRLFFGGNLTQVRCHALHSLGTTNRAVESRDVVLLNQRIGHTTTSCKSTTTTVCTRQHLLNLVNAGILLHLKLLCHKVQNNGRKNTQQTQGQNCR